MRPPNYVGYQYLKGADFGSVLDTKETFAHFRASEPGKPSVKNSFIRVAYRHRNLDLAKWLDSTPSGWDGHVNKTIRRLRFCSAYSIIKASQEGAEVESSSKSCKSPHCAICSRRRSTQISKRVVAAIQDKENEFRFKDKRFYFLTLTLKHDEKTRTGVYLDELKDYTKKLYRSKLWKDQFPFKKASMQSGWITCMETTISEETGYHIHAHIMICGPKLKTKATVFENEIRKKWRKVTGDSFIVQFQLLDLKKTADPMASAADKEKEVHGVVAELIKYGTKAGNFKSWNSAKAELYADWVEKTKGANFVTCSGLFRGLELAGAKSRYDEGREEESGVGEWVQDQEASYLMGPTSSIRFNSGTSAVSPELRKKILESVMLTKASGFQDVTNVVSQIRYLQNYGFGEEERETVMRLIEEAKEGVIVSEIKPMAVEDIEERNRQMQLWQFKMPKAMPSMISEW